MLSLLRKKKKKVANLQYAPMSDREMREALATGSTLPIYEAIMSFFDKKIAECVNDGIREDNPNRDWTDGKTAGIYELQAEIKDAAGSAAERQMQARRKEREAEIMSEAKAEWKRDRENQLKVEEKKKELEKAKLTAQADVAVPPRKVGDKASS